MLVDPVIGVVHELLLRLLQLVQEETRSSLQSVLTPEQMDKLDKKMREQARKNGVPKK